MSLYIPSPPCQPHTDPRHNPRHNPLYCYSTVHSTVYLCSIQPKRTQRSAKGKFQPETEPAILDKCAARDYNAFMFFDKARIYVKAGDGGNGIVAFRREKFVRKGGPFGGSGGRGGNVIFVVDPELNTLAPFQHQIHYRAERGTHGGGANKTGARGLDLIVPVPPGTLVHHAETGELLADLTRPGRSVVVARGGRGGRGNSAFKSARNSAPRMAENGEAGEELWVTLELKLVADVGIIGVPNAGKSTLLSVISAAKPKIADYPFTTVAPILGVAEVDHRQIVVADIPGLLEGAHMGVGLGLDFLRHIERTRLLIHLINGDSPDPMGDFEAINQELVLFNPKIADNPQLVVLNKMDLPHVRELWPEFEAAIQALGYPTLAISAATRENIQPLLYQVQAMLDALPSVEEGELVDEVAVLESPTEEKVFSIEQIDDGEWRVIGTAIERVAQMTNWDYYEASMRFQRILRAMGIIDALREAGVVDGDIVQIGSLEMVWGYDNTQEVYRQK
jgi:GTP-binding protein